MLDKEEKRIFRLMMHFCCSYDTTGVFRSYYQLPLKMG